MNHGGGMANQQPQQPYFIPRVAGVPQPPPQAQPLPQPPPPPPPPWQPVPQAPLPTEFQTSTEYEAPAEYQAPTEVAFQPQYQPPPAPSPAVPPSPFIGRTPFAVPQKSKGGFFRAMAHYCWIAVLLAIGVNLALNAAKLPATDESSLIKAVILGSIWVSGIVAGIIALFGTRKHGRKGILIPALLGMLLWMVMLALTALMIPLIQKVKEVAARQDAPASVEASAPSVSIPAPVSDSTPKAELSQSPAVLPEGSTRVEDTDLGFSFALLHGYSLPPDAKPEEKHLYKRKFMTEPTRIIEVRKFEGDFTRHLAAAKHFPPPAEGQTSESAVFDWRGRKVGGTRSVDSKRNPSYLTLNIVIPLRRQSVVVTVGGAEEYEPVLQEVVDQVLGSLSEEAK